MYLQLSQNANQHVDGGPSRESAMVACRRFVDCYYAGYAEMGNTMSQCQKDILNRYKQGTENATHSQSVLNTQVGKDKYWNSSLDDSPYDIMYDITAVGRIMFEDIQEPLQVLFYHMPNFKGSANASASAP